MIGLLFCTTGFLGTTGHGVFLLLAMVYLGCAKYLSSLLLLLRLHIELPTVSLGPSCRVSRIALPYLHLLLQDRTCALSACMFILRKYTGTFLLRLLHYP